MAYDAVDMFYDLLDSDQKVYDEYMEYIMEYNDGERVICNGDDLLIAAEQGYLLDQFREHWLELNTRDWDADADRYWYELEQG